jgi:GNAT superfamily N-acetyltransferase
MPDMQIRDQLSIVPFNWECQWKALWDLRHYQLAEEGIIIPIENNPGPPQDTPRDANEWDYDHIREIYLVGAGGFWFAWLEGMPVGHIAGQDFGDGLELRHMYVRREYRRRGIGTSLVKTLLNHARSQSIKTVELWTAQNGDGQKLYESTGFRVVSQPGKEFFDLVYRSNYSPGKDEVRMRFDL